MKRDILIPKKISELLSIAQTIMSAIRDNPEVYRDAPIGADELFVKINAVATLLNELLLMKSKFIDADTRLKDAVTALNDGVLDDRRYIMYISKANPSIVVSAGLKPYKTGKVWRAPSQCRSFKILSNDDQKIVFIWQLPLRGSGGRCSFFQIFGKEKGTDKYFIMANSIIRRAEVFNLVKGKTYEFYVAALNRNGMSLHSNTVTVKF